MKSKLIFTILLLTHLSAPAFTITSVDGGSYSETISNVINLYGGMAGTCSTLSPSSTCNTCVDAAPPAVACNTKNIHPDLQIGITITPAATIANRTVHVYTGVAGPTGAKTEIGTSRGTINFVASQTITVPVTVTWGEVCAEDPNFDNNCVPTSATTTGTNFESSRKIFVEADEDGDSSEEESEIESFNIKLNHVAKGDPAIDAQDFCTSPNTSALGICGFKLNVGGDEKLSIKELYSSGVGTGAPNNLSGAPDWHGVALFYAQTNDPANISNMSSEPAIKLYKSTTDYELIDNTITGLENYKQYCVVMGNVNKAQNIFLMNVSGTVPVADVCGTPSEVVGLLDDKSCFISTAAFGSNMAIEVETFRQFRNHFLLTNHFGKSFVKAYYKYSPPLADFISQSEVLRFLARMMLYPFYFFSVLSLKFGAVEALFAFVIGLLLFRKTKLLMKNSKNKSAVLKIFFVIFCCSLIATKSYAFLDTTTKETHPSAEADGLVKIDKDGNYIYKAAPQNVSQASHLRVGKVSNPDISIEICDVNDANCNTVTFDDIYQGASGVGIEYEYERFFFTDSTTRFGKIGLQAGVAVNYAEGHGRLVSDPAVESIESFSFLTVPLFAGVLYRFEYKDRQLLVPYISGGGSYVVLAEKREDRSKVNAIGAPGFYGSGGALLNLSVIDREMGADFESEYEIQNLWLSLEFKFISVTSEVFTLENGYIQAGMGFDF